MLLFFAAWGVGGGLLKIGYIECIFVYFERREFEFVSVVFFKVMHLLYDKL